MDTAAEEDTPPVLSFPHSETIHGAARALYGTVGFLAAATGVGLPIAAVNAEKLTPSDVTYMWQVAPGLLAAGVVLLFVVGQAITFWFVTTAAGVSLYLSEYTHHWATAGWSQDILLIAAAFVVCATALASATRPVHPGIAFFVLFLVAGAYVLNLREAIHTEAIQLLRSGTAVLTVVWACLCLRSGLISHIGSVFAYGGIAALVSEQLAGWSPAGWHTRVLTAAAVSAVVGVVAVIGGLAARGLNGAAAATAVVWVVASTWALPHWQAALRLGPGWIVGARIVAVAVGILGAAALTAAAIRLLFEGDEVWYSRVPMYLCCSWAAWIGIAAGVVAVQVLTEVRLPAEASGALVTTVALTFSIALVAVWSVLVITVDRAYVPPPRAAPLVNDLEVLVRLAVIEGPRGMGQGPFLALAGAVAVALLEALPHGSITGIVQFLAAAVFIFGVTQISIAVMRQFHERALAELDEAEPDEPELAYLDRQKHLVPVAVAGGLTAILMEIAISSTQAGWFPRLLTLLITTGGFVAAFAPFGNIALESSLRRGEHSFADIRFDLDDDLGRFPVLATISFGAGTFAVAVLITFRPAGFGTLVWGLGAAAAFGMTYYFGWRLLTMIVSDRTAVLVSRVERLTSDVSPVYRLLPLVKAPQDTHNATLRTIIDRITPPASSE